jgi:IclR family KDG regulon transcriptional repressor
VVPLYGIILTFFIGRGRIQVKMEAARKKYQETGTQALRRALSILNSFSQDNLELSLSDLSKSLSLPKGTVHRLLSSLRHESFIEQNESNHRYRLGWRLFELGACVDTINILQKKAHPYLEELCGKSKETVHLAVLKDGDIFYIDKIIGAHRMTIVTSVGLRLPSHIGGLGKSLIAFSPEEELEKIFKGKTLTKFTKNTITELDKLKLALKRVRESGFAIDNEEFEIGLTCVGIPIKDFTDKVVAAISISGPTLRMNKDMMPYYTKLALEAGKKISNALGFKDNSGGSLK